MFGRFLPRLDLSWPSPRGQSEQLSEPYIALVFEASVIFIPYICNNGYQ